MRISDWSSDVCSSDLKDAAGRADLDDARAELVQPAHLAARFLGAVDHRRLLAVHRRRQSAAVAMPAGRADRPACGEDARSRNIAALARSEEHTSELQSLMRISYAVFCLKKKKTPTR